MSSIRSVKEFTRSGNSRRHRCERLYRVLCKEAEEHRDELERKIAEGGLRRITFGPSVGRYTTSSEDILNPWRSCIIALEKFSGPGVQSCRFPACGSLFSHEHVESGRRIELVDDKSVIVESKD